MEGFPRKTSRKRNQLFGHSWELGSGELARDLGNLGIPVLLTVSGQRAKDGAEDDVIRPM